MEPSAGMDFYAACIGLDALLLLLLSFDPGVRRVRAEDASGGWALFAVAQVLLFSIAASLLAMGFGDAPFFFWVAIGGTGFGLIAMITTLSELGFGEHRMGDRLGFWVPLAVMCVFCIVAFGIIGS